MGMAASQSRLLQLTSRKHSIGYQLTMLSNDKIALARETQKISKEYQTALQSKTLKWSNNQGVSYIDLSYSNLMRPSNMNLNKPYLLTDQNGKVVVDSKYRDYAEMISANGAPNGNWKSVRTEILSELIPEMSTDKIESKNKYSVNAEQKKRELEQIKEKEPSRRGFRKDSTPDKLLEKVKSDIPLSSNQTDTWAHAYTSNATIELGNASTAGSILESLYNTLETDLAPYFMDDADKFKEAVKKQKEANVPLLTNSYEGGTLITGNNNNGFKIDLQTLINNLIGAYEHEGGELSSNEGYTGADRWVWYDIDTDAHTKWVTEHDKWEETYKEAEAAYNEATNNNSTLLTANDEKLIDFYDKIFSSIAEKGWTYNNSVEDSDYLNQILQNNIYTITTVDTETEYDCKKGVFTSKNEYSTDIASNLTTIATVSDTNKRDDALVDYEYKKSILNAKETRIDTRMKDLETEQSSINQMIQGIEQVRNDNIERNFSIMS